MDRMEYEAILANKLEILAKLNEAATGINTALKSRDFSKALKIDSEKASLLKKLEEIDKKEGIIDASKQYKDGNSAELAVKINAIFETLIAKEKENDVLTTEAAGFFSRGRVDSYKQNIG